jgi:hypothetical protein
MCTWYALLRCSPLWFPSPRHGSEGEHIAVVAKSKFWYLHLATSARCTNSILHGERRKWRHTPSCERAKSKRVATIGVEDGGESGETTHPTQLNPRWPEPLDELHPWSTVELIGYSHKCSLKAGPNFKATPSHPCEASWHHLFTTKSGGVTFQGKNLICLTYVCKSIHFTVAKWLLVAGRKQAAERHQTKK